MRRLARALNLTLLLAFPIAWSAPLMRAGMLPFFHLSEISILSGIATLWHSDPGLALLVALLALVAPYAKIVVLAGIQTGYLSARALPLVKAFGRLAMADIFLVALYIILAKGLYVGHIETAWGLWLFTACVSLSLMLSWATPAPPPRIPSSSL